jgi:uncharacterized protein
MNYSNEGMRNCQTGNGRRDRNAVRAFVAVVLFIWLWPTVGRAEKVSQLSPQGYVNDFAGVLDPATRLQLTDLCRQLDQKANAQIAVVTIHSLEGDTVQDFANRLFQKWGVGPKGKDRGVMILLAVDDHRYWTEIGYGLEPILPDGKVGGFGREMVPLLRQNQYGPALVRMTSDIADVIARDQGIILNQVQVPVQSAAPSQPVFDGIPSQFLSLLILFALFGGWRLLTFFLFSAGWSRYRRGRGYRGGWWMGPMGGWGGGSGGGSWGGGGFGGFGGGMSGGGGAGGSW